jgi:hypothetical protein
MAQQQPSFDELRRQMKDRLRLKCDPDELRRLTAVFRDLGADDPESWALSELAEGIPQLAHFIFLKQAWSAIEDERETSWIDRYIEQGKGERAAKTFWGSLGGALERMRARGVADKDLATVVQAMQYLLLGSICGQLDDCDSSPINARGDWPRVRWALFQVDSNGKPLKPLGGLHEYADSMDPTGRAGGFRV